MSSNSPHAVFFIGIGGIGMSALARYFLAKGYPVLGYDKTASDLTEDLICEGALITYEEEWDERFSPFMDTSPMVIYTPAIPQNSFFIQHFQSKNTRLLKRSEVLGEITRSNKGLCVAGTHGKSTTSALLAFLLHDTTLGCNAFLGAIATNFNSNFLIDPNSQFSVIEADEFDRSFLHLSPYAAIITNIDPDHLDIYETEEKFKEGFRQFAMKIDPGGILLVKEGIQINSLCRKKTYALNSETADYYAVNLKETDQGCTFDFCSPKGTVRGISIGIHGFHNGENALAALALCEELGLSVAQLALKFSNFKGLKRRFETIYSDDDLTYIDDYAHHPTEINRLISSVKFMFPGQKITGVFQPHLFTRTRDFGTDFAEELSELDEVLLLPIYPARELPIQGIDSEWLLNKIKLKQKSLVQKSELLERLRETKKGILLTIGAGDIDRMVEPIKEMLLINEQTK